MISLGILICKYLMWLFFNKIVFPQINFEDGSIILVLAVGTCGLISEIGIIGFVFSLFDDSIIREMKKEIKQLDKEINIIKK